MIYVPISCVNSRSCGREKCQMQISDRLLLIGLFGVIFTLTCGLTLNCATANDIQQQPSMEELRTAQIIIKFRNDVRDPSQHDFIEGLSRDASAKLVYVRPMSGGAHVFRVDDIADSVQLTEVMQRLSKRPDILYVEQDAIMQFQREK
jgi:hypothetical protein